MSTGNKKFEEAISELEAIVDKLENGELSLDESIEYFQKGIELSKYCSKKLDEVEKKISILTENEQGKLEEEVIENE
ncbi:MAG TPA: exodeoxyribonuclease VII small subunit [Clostridiaceae bacterium]|nr:exodeoxyribonuclease VII small subunit [Clostridiaceae bacterium]